MFSRGLARRGGYLHQGYIMLTSDRGQTQIDLFMVEYFDHIHPSFPFLDRTAFEKNVRDSGLASTTNISPQLSALYHAVLALGCQHHGGGSFEPGKGKAWNLFLVAMNHGSDKEYFKDSLTSLQVCICLKSPLIRLRPMHGLTPLCP